MPNIKETTGISPLTIVTDGSELLDWRITGTQGKIGKRGKNYLKQREITVPNGAAGTFLDSVFHAWVDPFEGRTFNSGKATRIYFTIRRSDNSNLVAANVGDFMLVEGTAIPTAYDADTNLYKKPILQGSSVYHTSDGVSGESQVIYTNEDEYGRTVMYGQGSEATAMRCKTYSIKLQPNTDYSVRIFNSSYSDLQIGGTFMTEPGTVEQYIPNLNNMGGGIVNLPSCEPFVASNEQWTRLDTSHSLNDHNTNYPIDVRPYKFEFCESVAELDAGTYKLMIDILGNHYLAYGGGTSSCVGFGPYLGCYLDIEWDDYGYPHSPSNKFEHFALIGEDDSLIIPETEVFNSSTVRRKVVGDTPYPNFFHQEYTFTVPRKMKVGVLHRAYSRWNYYYGDGDTSPWFRFMICDTDVEAEEFETSGLQYDIAGESAWEPYNITLDLTVHSAGGGEIHYDLHLEDYLTAGQSISLQDTGTIISTWYGRNTIDCDSEIKPELYLKYYAGEEINMWAAERPEQVNIYDLHEPQNGFDHNGVAVLMPSELVSEKEILGRWDISLVHPIDEYGKWTYIAGQNIIKVNGQLFRIDETEISMDSNSEYISAHANHITYDMSDYFIEEGSYEASDGADYVVKLSNSRIKDFPNQQHVIGEYIFDIRSDLDGPLKAEVKDQSMIEALFGADDSLAVRYGGKLYRDNFHLSIYKAQERAPSGYAFAIRYRKELTKISFKIDFSSWVTNLICEDNFGSMYAVWYDTSGDWIVHHHKTKKVHFTYAELGDPDSAMDRLIADGTNYWNSVNTPVISIVVEVANIKNDPAYKDFLNLQNYDVGYKGTVYVEHLGIDVEMQIVGIRRNELTGEVLNISLGNTRNSLIRQTVLSQTVSSGSTIADKQAAAVAEVQKEIDLLVMRTWGGLKKFKWSNAKKYTWKELKNGYKDS